MKKIIIIFLVLFIIRLLFVLPSLGRLAYTSQSLEEYSSFLLPLRSELKLKIDQLLPAPHNQLLAGILLGSKEDLDPMLKDALVKTSTIHIAVVSGQNLSILAGFFLGLAPFFGRKKTMAAALIFVLFYTFLSGLQIPVLRAFLMVFFSFLASFWGREKDSLAIVVLTALVMLVYEPRWLFSISFQLSFLATTALFTVAPLLEKIFQLPFLLKEDLSVSLAVALLVSPLIGFYFHSLNFIGVVVNTLVLWSITPIMIFGFLMLLVSLVSMEIASLLALIPETLLTFFLYVIEFFNNLSFGTLDNISFPLLGLLGYYLILAGILNTLGLWYGKLEKV